jgi:hypothetical protein
MRLDRLAVATLLWALLASLVAAQDSAPPMHLVHDWSNRHVIFTGLTPENIADAADADPRAWHTWVNHARHRFEPEPDREPDPEPDRGPSLHHRGHRHDKGFATDWNMPIGSTLGPTVYPAKFSFDVNATPDCANDFVVFPTATGGFPGSTGSGASLVAFNNLYAGPGPTGICPTPLAPAIQPSVLFAYNTATTILGKANQSPALSLDGKKIAFVESNDGFSGNYTAFHVLTWKAGEGTAWNSAAVPGDCSAGNSCMTTLVLNNTYSDSSSSPFVDYAHDTAYVGDGGGLLHKISPVFSGTPVEMVGSGWPVQLASAPDHVQSPVYDSVSARVFVADGNSALYVVDSKTGTIITTVPLNYFPQESALIVDSTNQTVFVFGGDLSPVDGLAVSQFNTSGSLLRKIDAATLGGNVSVFDGTFDNNYYTSPSSGALYFAGSANAHASLFSVGFTGKVMNSSFSGPLVLSTNSTTSIATPLTEVFNPSFASAPDRLFLAIDANCVNGSSNGCIESFDISHGFPSGILSSNVLATGGTPFSVSGIIVDNVSSLAQASSIYFESSPTGNPAQSAIKLTQSALQ